jgi:hypothetical protein
MLARARFVPHAAALLLTAALTLSSTTLVFTARAQEQSFDADDLRRLEAGELIERPVQRTRGSLRLIGGTSFQVVERSVSETWRALNDAASYRYMMPGADEARVVAHRPGTRVVRVRHSAGLVSAAYHLRLRYDQERRDIAFRLDESRPNDLRAVWGFISVAPWQDDPNRSIVSYGIMADVGGGVLGGILRGQIHTWMLRVPSIVREYLVGEARDRYED